MVITGAESGGMTGEEALAGIDDLGVIAQVTHLHADHFGWAWHPAPGSGRPAFNAG